MELVWTEILPEDVEGRLWKKTPTPFERIPVSAKNLSPGVLNCHSCTGVQCAFLTDSSVIAARWVLAGETLGEPNFNVNAHDGFDLYARNGNEWRWAGTTGHFDVKDTHPETVLLKDVPHVSRSYRLYFPLRNPVMKLLIGVEKNASFEKLPPRKSLPVVWYGTSIVHGAFSVRAGLALTNALSREIDHPVVNLGFSGAAKMEKEFADLLAPVDACCFIIDPMANMTPELVAERAEIFLRLLYASHPRTPVILCEDQEKMDSWLKPDQMRIYLDKCRKLSAIARRLKRDGMPLTCIRGRTLFGTDGEGTMDGIHPNDLGIYRMTGIIARTVKKVLAGDQQ